MESIQNSQQIKSVMRRVYVVWFVRRATRPAMMRVYIVLATGTYLVSTVSLASVISNASAYDAPRMATYLGQSFLTTELVVKIAALLAATGAAFVARDTYKKELSLPLSR
jgi:hypothetical protein